MIRIKIKSSIIQRASPFLNFSLEEALHFNSAQWALIIPLRVPFCGLSIPSQTIRTPAWKVEIKCYQLVVKICVDFNMLSQHIEEAKNKMNEYKANKLKLELNLFVDERERCKTSDKRCSVCTWRQAIINLPATVADWTSEGNQFLNCQQAQSTYHGNLEGLLLPRQKHKPENAGEKASATLAIWS